MKSSVSSSIKAKRKRASSLRVRYLLNWSRGENGHYVAFRKIQGNWYFISDEEVWQVPEMELPTQGHLFFLRRTE